MSQRKRVYFHKTTGNIARVTPAQAKKLSKGWERLRFTKNDKGERVMRFNFDGATVDVKETETEVVKNGHGTPN